MRESNAEHQAVTAHPTAIEPDRAGPPPTDPWVAPPTCDGPCCCACATTARARPRTSPRRLGVSRTGVLQQLHALETAGLVSRQAVRHGVGRPRHVYDVTAAAQDLFPTNYDGLASGLLAAIRAIGGEELVDGVFDERRRITRDRIRQRMADG